MGIVLADVGATQILAKYFNDVDPAGGVGHYLRLFANDYTPVDTSVIGNFTVAAGGGYAQKTLTQGSWTISDVAGIRQAAYAQQTFTFTGVLTTNPNIYGYYIVDKDEVVIYAERSAAAYTPTTNGDQLLITPVIQASKGTPT